MDDIKVLKEIGLKKVSNETHIEQKYLQYMVDCNFDKLDYVNTLGFIKILSREYNLDLSEFREAFEEYWNENRKSEDDEGLFIVVEDSSRGTKKFLIFLLVVILVATIGVVFSIFKDKVDLATTEVNETHEVIVEESAVVEEAKETLEKVVEANNSDEEIIIQDTNTTEENDNSVVEEENNTSKDITDVESLTTKDTEKVSKRFEKEALIVPNTKLWVGVIYLDNKKRRSYLGEGNFSIDLSREQIITTGHGSFSLHVGDETIEYKQETPVRLWVKDGNITKIRWSKFQELNEGKPW